MGARDDVGPGAHPMYDCRVGWYYRRRASLDPSSPIAAPRETVRMPDVRSTHDDVPLSAADIRQIESAEGVSALLARLGYDAGDVLRLDHDVLGLGGADVKPRIKSPSHHQRMGAMPAAQTNGFTTRTPPKSCPCDRSSDSRTSQPCLRAASMMAASQ